MAKILVVDDDEDIYEIVKYTAAQDRHEILRATDGKDGLKRTIADKPDLIILDIMMPEMDGYEATAEIRRMQGTGRRVPIVAITADVAEGTQDRCAAAGMDDFVSKPVSVDTIVRVLRRWLPAPPAQ